MFKDGDPLKPGIQKVLGAGGLIQSEVAQNLKNTAEDLATKFKFDPIGFAKSNRARNLPTDAVPDTRTTTSARIASPDGDNDWRVSLSMPDPLISMKSPLMTPLKKTGGRLIFPFTPSIIFSHSAGYSGIQPIHTNYSYFAYQNSSVDAITISGDFFVENAKDAEYWVGALTFLRTMTKMFYGDGPNVGNPPMITKLNGYGDYVFNNVPCIITGFNIDMPQDVDYFRTDILGSDLPEPTSTSKKGTWVPAQSLIAVTVQPVYSRRKVAQFNLKDFVNGDLITGKGFV